MDTECNQCGGLAGETDRFFHGFTFECESYHDSPIDGWLRCNQCGRWFAFESETIVRDLLWHWVLVPAERTVDAGEAIAAARSGWWLSVVEDPRGGPERQWAVRIETGRSRPPSFRVRATQRRFGERCKKEHADDPSP
jgi:hypothetical protein